jgi:hypothetical protein
MGIPSQRNSTEICQQSRQMLKEACCRRAIDNAVIP